MFCVQGLDLNPDHGGQGVPKITQVQPQGILQALLLACWNTRALHARTLGRLGRQVPMGPGEEKGIGESGGFTGTW